MELTSKWGRFIKGVDALINEIIDETKDMGPSFQSYGLHKVVKTDQVSYNTVGVVGLGLLEGFDESNGIKEDETYPAYETKYIAKDMGKIVTISQRLAETSPVELKNKLDKVKQLKIAQGRTANKMAWRPLVDAFSTTDSSSDFPVCRLNDDVAMISASHPSKVPGVAVRSNLLAGNPVLSDTSLFNAQLKIIEQLNGRGLPINFEGGFILVVPPKLKRTATELLNSPQKIDSMDNNINYYKGEDIDLAVINYISAANGGSDTAWFLIAKDPMGEQSMRFVTLIEPKIETEADFYTKAIAVSIDFSASVGYSNFEFITGSAGA